MSTPSPAKRRALAPLDANARSPALRASPFLKPQGKTRPTPPPPSPTRIFVDREPDSQKRTLEVEGASPAPATLQDSPAKKARREAVTSPRSVTEPVAEKVPATGDDADEVRTRSTSPEESSVFDTTEVDISRETAVSEPDARIPPPRRIQNEATRHIARESVERIRLRLRLAAYKVQTNQTNIPLELLQRRPLPTSHSSPAPRSGLGRSISAISSTSTCSESSSAATLYPASSQNSMPSARLPQESLPSETSVGAASTLRPNITRPPVLLSPERASSAADKLPPALSTLTPNRIRFDEERLTSSALRGGAANGLLELARGSSSV